MSLNAGIRLGQYEIVAPLGVGGMGEVYRARDSRLDRDVALKILPDVFAADPDRLARFEREAKTLAALNHPNIAHIYGLEQGQAGLAGQAGKTLALVMELVEGEDLAQRISRGPLQLDEAVPIAKQIAEALGAAHEQGIIHRDLKPANVKVRPDGTVKVLDFGLAKALTPEGSGATAGSSMSMSPTITTPAMTQAGTILGTAAYMAPEQARGRTVDRRADIWAFGAVLYEMLAATRAFPGEDITDTIVSVVSKEPAWAALPAATPAGVRRLLARCLKKDPKARLRDIGEARIALEDVIAGVAPDVNPSEPVARAQTHSKAAWLPRALAGAAVLTAGIALGAWWMPWRPAATVPDLVRLEIQAPPKSFLDNALILSPDGRHLAYTTTQTSEGGGQIWVRSLDTLQARRVAPWATNPVPFWSSDSRFIAYQQGGKLKKVAIAGGPPTTLCDAPAGFGGGAWHDDVIVFGDRAGGLMQVASGGGTPVPLTMLDLARGEVSHALPSFLPDGQHFVYLRRSTNANSTGIYVGSVGVAPDKQDSNRLVFADTAAVYAPAPDATGGPGFLLFLRSGTLMAQPFDAAAIALQGEAVPVAERVGETVYGLGRFSTSSSGSLAYSTGSTGSSPTRLIWFDRNGKNVGEIGQPGRYDSLAISPDGSRVAAEKYDGLNSDLWLIGSAPGGKSDRFTFGAGTETSPVWSPDGAHIVFAAGPPGAALNLFRKPSNMASDDVELFKSSERRFPTDWSRDAKALLLTSIGSSADLWSLALGSSGTPEASAAGATSAQVFLKTDAIEFTGKLSPDGRWMAFVSRQGGRDDVYVRPFPLSPDRTGQQMVSSDGGGDQPLWRQDGKELFYRRRGPGLLMAVPVQTGAVFTSAQPKALFTWPMLTAVSNGMGYNWGANPDGSRFLLNVRDVEINAEIPIIVVLNWTQGLKR